jgi:ubiquinone biosynthesis protein Coq4
MNFDALRGLYYAVRVAMNPNNTELVFRLTSAIRNPATRQAIVSGLKVDPEVATVLEAKPPISRLSLDRLRACPDGSVGKAALEFFETNKLDPGIFPIYDNDDDFDYFRTRMGNTHDLRHVLTGFGTDLLGEVAQQAFDLAQIRQGLSAIILAIALAKSALEAPQNLAHVMHAITEGYAMGKRTRNLFVIDIEKFYDRSLTEVRSELGLTA